MSTKQSEPTDSQSVEYLPCGIRNVVEDDSQVTELEATPSPCGLRQNILTETENDVDSNS